MKEYLGKILVRGYLKASAPVAIKVQKLAFFLLHASRSFQEKKFSDLYPFKINIEDLSPKNKTQS